MSEKITCIYCGKITLKKHKARHLRTCQEFKKIETKGGDIQNSKITSTLLKPFTWEKYPGERHLFKHNYTGPGTRLDIRLDENNEPKPGEEPINRVDEAALKHDIAYNNENIRDRHIADVNLIHDLNNIPQPTSAEKLQRTLVKLAMKAKLVFGGTVQKNKTITQNELIANELHKQYVKPKYLRKVIINYKDETWGGDIADMVKKSTDHEKFRYILVCIDLYTRFGFCIPMINKKQETLKQAFETIFEESNRMPDNIWFDKESAIKSKYFDKFIKENKINLYHTENEGKSVFAERFIRTLKNKMFKHFTAVRSTNWNKLLLNEIVNDYNNTIHSTIKVTPQEASKSPEKIKEINEKNNSANNFKEPKQKFHIGDRVRLFALKGKFEKGYTAKWTEEIFIIKKVYYWTNPITYGIVDLDGEEVIGKFYSNELQKTLF